MSRYVDVDRLIGYVRSLAVQNKTYEVEVEKAINEWLNQTSTANVGRWNWNGGGVYCSVCNYKLQSTGLPSYCPHCCSRMEE